MKYGVRVRPPQGEAVDHKEPGNDGTAPQSYTHMRLKGIVCMIMREDHL